VSIHNAGCIEHSALFGTNVFSRQVDAGDDAKLKTLTEAVQSQLGAWALANQSSYHNAYNIECPSHDNRKDADDLKNWKLELKNLDGTMTFIHVNWPE
jgi:hypothetical protein